MANLGNAWHLPTNPEPRGLAGMRNPVFPTSPLDAVTIAMGNQFQGGGNAGNQLQIGSTVFFRRRDDAAWTSTPLLFAATVGNNKYYSATIPTTGLNVGTIIDYYLRIAYDDHDTTFLLANPGGTISSTTDNENAARATPFSFALDSPAVRGRWGAVFSLPNVAVHSHVLPDGRVLMWGRRDNPNQSLDVDPRSPIHVGQPPALSATCTPFIWNPATGGLTMTTQPSLDAAGAKKANLFCSGHAFLPDGRLLVAGGHLADSSGLNQTCTFDHSTGKWTPGAVMNHGRWYPTLTTLTDGSVLIVSGSYVETKQLNNTVPQIWSNGALTAIAESPAGAFDLYPRMHVASNGRVFITGSLQQTWVLDVSGDGTWSRGPLKTANGQRDYAPSVLYDLDKVLYVGGGNQPTANADLLDLSQASPVWTATKPMDFPRRQHNATILADGTVLVTGGTRSGGSGAPQNFNNLDPGQPIHVAELWHPSTQQWTSLAAEDIDRCYHSTAVLLPDATVLSAGGGEFFPIEQIKEENDPADSHLDAQVFTPPYLCTGASRPVISSAPDTTAYGATFHVETAHPDEISKVTWIRLSSVTHSFNTGQRYTELHSQAAGTGLDVTAPASALVCPPGHYMMFLIDKAGVPSVAKIMQIRLPAAAHPLAEAPPRVELQTRRPPRDVLALRDAVLAAATGTQVVVGLTGTCPYGIGACWGGAHEALTRLDGVEAVDPVPDGAASTATVFVTGGRLPDLETWRAQLHAVADESYRLRGIEISLTGELRRRTERLDLAAAGLVIRLGPLNPADIVQWDPQQRAPRPASNAEMTAYARLSVDPGALSEDVPLTVTGPLRRIGAETTLEVREWKSAR